MESELAEPYVLANFKGKQPPAPSWFIDAIACEPQRSLFESNGADIELLTWGKSGNPGLLFLHGNGAHADWWSMIAPLFSRDWHCAAISLSGMGRSARRPDGYKLSDFAQEVRDAVAAAGLEGRRKPVLVGHSMGGMVGLHAASGTDLFGGLIMIDSPIGTPPERLAQLRASGPKARREHRPFATIEDGIARFRMMPPQPCDNLYIADHIARRSLVEHGDQWVWHFDPRRVSTEGNDEPSMDALRCPMAYIHGDRSALLTPEALADALSVLPARTPVVAIPDAAHHVPIDQPLALVAALRTLLASWTVQDM